MVVKLKKNMKRLDVIKITIKMKNIFYLVKEIKNLMKKLYQIKGNHILSQLVGVYKKAYDISRKRSRILTKIKSWKYTYQSYPTQDIF